MIKDWYAPFGDEGMNDSGIKVIGPNTANGAISVWHFGEDEKAADAFAKQLAQKVQENVLIVRLVGRYRPVALPVEYVPVEQKQAG